VVVLRVFVKKTNAAPRDSAGIGTRQGGKAMSQIRVDDVHEKWMTDSDYRREYEALEVEFSLVAAMIAARTRAGLTQEEVASA
jgi:hypothetical protein